MGMNDADIIPFQVFLVVNGTFMGLALLMAAARIVIKLYVQRKLYPDDVVLMFACLTFITSQAILYTYKIDILYWHKRINVQNLYSILLADPEPFIRRYKKVLRIEFSSLALTFASIYAVKVCFLLLFYHLINRLQRLLLAWKAIFGITIIFGALCIGLMVFDCLHFEAVIVGSSQGRELTRLHIVGVISGCLDIISDLFLISIPLIVLWKAKIKRQQKIFFGILLCLSGCMIIVAIIRSSRGLVQMNTFDPVWLVFWHQTEGAVAIIVVSLTTFRSLLGIKARKAGEKKLRERSWFSRRPQLLARYLKKTAQDEPKSQQLPSIPRATLTGIRTFINGDGICDDAMGIPHMSGKDWPRAVSHDPQEIELAQLSTELDILDGAKSARAANFV